MFDSPIWWVEDKVFSAWEFITGHDRLALRTLVLVLSLIFASLGTYETPVGVAVFAIWIGMRWFNWPYPHESGYQMDIVRFLTATITYFTIQDMFFAVWKGWADVFWETGWLLLWLSDYILWAHHINRPRKRRKPLPEHLKELFSSLDWVPKPVADH